MAEKFQVKINTVIVDSAEKLLDVWLMQTRWTDILLMEMDMSSKNGIEVSEILRKRGYKGKIIFHTNDKNEVFNSFYVDAFHYVLKDSSTMADWEKIAQKAIENVREMEEDYITFNFAGEFVTVRVDDITYIEVERKMCILHYEDGKTFEFYSTLSKLDDQLCAKGFIRPNRFALLNISHIKRRTKVEIEMQDGKVFTIGRNYKKQVLETLAG